MHCIFYPSATAYRKLSKGKKRIIIFVAGCVRLGRVSRILTMPLI